MILTPDANMATSMVNMTSTIRRTVVLVSYQNMLAHLWQRCFCLTVPVNKMNYKKMVAKQDRVMQKIIQGAKKSGKNQDSLNVTNWVSPAGSWFNKVSNKVTSGSQRRAHQLSVVFHEYITSLINSGEVDQELVDLGLEIARVKVAPDFSNVSVYWVATGTDKDSKIDSSLKANASKLRYLVAKYKLSGNLPPFQFIKDSRSVKTQLLDKLIDQADKGPDHTELSPAEAIKTHIVIPQGAFNSKQLQASFSNVASKFQSSDHLHTIEGPGGSLEIISQERANVLQAQRQENITEKTETESDSYEATGRVESGDPSLPERSDIFDLNHNKILQQIISSKQKAKHGNQSWMKKLDSTDSFNLPSDVGKIRKEKQHKGARQLRKELSSDYHMEEQESIYEREDYMYEEEDTMPDQDHDSPDHR